MEASGKHYLTCLWPGLPEMWFRGQLAALPAALTFALAVNFLLVARFIYPEWLTPMLVKLACWAAVGVWIYCVAKSVQRLPAVVSPRAVCDQPDRFAEAHIQYLRGHWVEAEALLSDCLEIESRDPPAMLLLAGVYRHTHRLAAAANLLEQLERLERGDFWWLELQDERKRLQRFEAAAAEAENESEPESADEPEAADGSEASTELEAASSEPESTSEPESASEPESTSEPETVGEPVPAGEPEPAGESELASNSPELPASEGREINHVGDASETMQGAEGEGEKRETLDSLADSPSAAATDQAFAAELADDWPAPTYRTV